MLVPAERGETSLPADEASLTASLMVRLCLFESSISSALLTVKPRCAI